MRKIMVVVLTAVMLAGCGPTEPEYPPDDPSITTIEVTIREGWPVQNLDPPTRLNVILENVGDPVQRCLDMGGTYSFEGDTHMCRDVDY